MNRADLIADYYNRIDNHDLDAIIRLFAQDAVYRRADRQYAGKSRISRFFREERLIRGIHTVEAMWQVPGRVIVIGHFDGVGEHGDPRSLGFVDIWAFDASNAVTERRTYLATGHWLVER
ncbi:nuclear transport factor 2 family protein [Sphingorhabdus contaminans]|uniref:nuclear transport factor 2 family protein n=1 Tax=Sphingorhabdus contaminans TaxID=1343899 RepID=UPI003D2C4EA8